MFTFFLSATRVLNSFEELCITLAATGNSFARELNTPWGSIYMKKLTTSNPNRKWGDLLRNKVNTIAFRFYWTIIRTIKNAGHRKLTPTWMSSVFRSSQHFLGLHKFVPWSLYSYFRFFLGIYMNKKTQIYMIWISSKTRNDLKSLDELTEHGFCTMFLISGDVFLKNQCWFIDQKTIFSCYTTFPHLYIFLHLLYIHLYLTSLI